MNGFQILVPYRDNIEEGRELISIDNEDLVIGLQSFGITPVNALTDGRKLMMTFIREDKTMEVFQQIQRALADAVQVPLMVDYTRIVKNRMGWKGMLTMMRSVPIQKG